MKTHFWIILFSLTFGFSVSAQIKFEKMTLTEAKAKAKKEKPILLRDAIQQRRKKAKA